jgi:SAM-dependent methyltransferase
MSQAVVVASPARLAPPLFATAVFTSAALVFVLEPMIAKLVLPKLGGSAAVWNTCMVFFQAALLVGYGYAHLLQRLRSLKAQIAVHLALLAAAAIVLPLHVTGLLGDPEPGAPIRWLLAVLALSVGPPFAVLSATAPLLQAWYARVRAGEADAKNPYVLYAASNLGSFIALIAYPALIEPLLRLHAQSAVWTGGYALFFLAVGSLGYLVWQAGGAEDGAPLVRSPAPAWRERLVWVLLAAAPSSLMLGVTTHLSTDIASAPFLWVAPLALYLLTFVVAFQSRPLIPPRVALLVQGGVLALCTALLPFNTPPLALLFLLHLSAFFLTALVCHQALAARRPAPDRLTEFYLLLSLGGVLGGVFTALVAPVVFKVVWEYPIVLVLAALARPWGLNRKPDARPIFWMVGGAVVALAPALIVAAVKADPETLRAFVWPKPFTSPGTNLEYTAMALLVVAGACAFVLRDRAPLMAVVLGVMAFGAQSVVGRYHWLVTERSFFGVMRTATFDDPLAGGAVTMLMHGTTLHGAQAQNPKFRCTPMLYYAPTTPIGQAVAKIQARAAGADIGVVGLGAGSVAAYARSTDRVTYFEIDPAVERFALNPARFSFVHGCAQAPVDVVLGDARLTLAGQPSGRFDLLIVDAFSSDSVPTHLLTEEALQGYLRVMKPGGVVLLHLSNRNLDIVRPAAAGAHALGAASLVQFYTAPATASVLGDASTDALIFARKPLDLTDFAADPRWKTPAPGKVRPWTDDYTNLVGALWRRRFEARPG